MLCGCGLCVKCCWVCVCVQMGDILWVWLSVCVWEQVNCYLHSPALPVPVTGVCVFVVVLSSVCVKGPCGVAIPTQTHLGTCTVYLFIIINIGLYYNANTQTFSYYNTLKNNQDQRFFFFLQKVSQTSQILPKCFSPVVLSFFFSLETFFYIYKISPYWLVFSSFLLLEVRGCIIFTHLTLCVLEVHSQCGSASDAPDLTLSWPERSLRRARWLAVAVATETALLLWRDTVLTVQPFTLQGQKTAFSHPHFLSSLPPLWLREPVLVQHGGVDSWISER